jgi:hypothetical protein
VLDRISVELKPIEDVMVIKRPEGNEDSKDDYGKIQNQN